LRKGPAEARVIAAKPVSGHSVIFENEDQLAPLVEERDNVRSGAGGVFRPSHQVKP